MKCNRVHSGSYKYHFIKSHSNNPESDKVPEVKKVHEMSFGDNSLEEVDDEVC